MEDNTLMQSVTCQLEFQKPCLSGIPFFDNCPPKYLPAVDEKKILGINTKNGREAINTSPPCGSV
jgi:hypothetical protein